MKVSPQKSTKKKRVTGRKRVTFQITAKPGSNTYLVGSFNDWNEKSKKMKDAKNNGHYSTTLLLFKGEYEYKFLINGEWHIDPERSQWVQNEYGTLNSLLIVS